MVSEVVVRDGDGGGAFRDISKPIRAVREVVVVDPDVFGTVNGNGIPVRLSPIPEMLRRAAHRGWTSGLAIVDVDTVHNDV